MKQYNSSCLFLIPFISSLFVILHHPLCNPCILTSNNVLQVSVFCWCFPLMQSLPRYAGHCEWIMTCFLVILNLPLGSLQHSYMTTHLPIMFFVVVLLWLVSPPMPFLLPFSFLKEQLKGHFKLHSLAPHQSTYHYLIYQVLVLLHPIYHLSLPIQCKLHDGREFLLICSLL